MRLDEAWRGPASAIGEPGQFPERPRRDPVAAGPGLDADAVRPFDCAPVKVMLYDTFTGIYPVKSMAPDGSGRLDILKKTEP